MDRYYPIMLNIKGKKCKVIGGGIVAERKVITLIEHGALVTVISPLITEKLQKHYNKGKITIIKREYVYGDLEGCYMVYAATDDEETNKTCMRECRENGILLNVVDKPDMCDFIVPANINRGHLNISVSTNGKSPMLSRRIRENLERIFTDEYEEYLEILGEIRELVKREINDIEKRRKIFQQIVYSDIFDRYISGEELDLKEELYKIYTNHFELQGDESNGKK